MNATYKAVFEEQSGMLRTPYAYDFAKRLFPGLDIDAHTTKYVRGPHAGKPKGFLFWKRCIRGGWVKTGRYDFDSMHGTGFVQAPNQIVCAAVVLYDADGPYIACELKTNPNYTVDMHVHYDGPITRRKSVRQVDIQANIQANIDRVNQQLGFVRENLVLVRQQIADSTALVECLSQAPVPNETIVRINKEALDRQTARQTALLEQEAFFIRQIAALQNPQPA